MARCKLTNMNLRNIRKSREYQCLLIDFVKVGVVGKTAAEGLLGYTIPAGLIADDNSTVTPEPEEDDTEDTVTLLYFDPDANEGAGGWDSVEYTLTGDDEADDIGMRSLAGTTWGESNIGDWEEVELNPAYEASSAITDMYITLNPAHEHFAAGQIYKF